jgi:hypothetical protein
MTSPQGMDELFWGREYEDVSDWAERLTMAAEVRDLNADKLFKIAKLTKLRLLVKLYKHKALAFKFFPDKPLLSRILAGLNYKVEDFFQFVDHHPSILVFFLYSISLYVKDFIIF